MRVLEKKGVNFYICQDKNGNIVTLSKKELDLEERKYVPYFIGPSLFLDKEIKYELFFLGYPSELFPRHLIPDDVFLSLKNKKKSLLEKIGANKNLPISEKDLILLLKENNLLY